MNKNINVPKKMGRTMFTLQEGPINAISLNKDASQIVIGGRNVFKIFSIDDEGFTEKCNLRVGKNLNLNFSVADVVWNFAEDHILASAATNGAVVTWNLNKTSRSKQDMIYMEHKRTVNKVGFHPTECHLLLSGSQDGTMKLFDLRQRKVTSTYISGSQTESVRDVQFSPHHYFQFAAALENGNVQLWDMRRTDRLERQFTGHRGPVFALDWHPEEKWWLATAGRDKTIKIWDWSLKSSLEHCIQTIASVARIKWRPQRKYHISSCALVVDFSINVWDIRRPFIPFAAFNEHKDVATGIAWRHDPHVFLSSSKDSTLFQHYFRDATRPADHANPMSLAINIRGDISCAVSAKILDENSSSGKGGGSATRLPLFFRKTASLSEQFRAASSTFHIFKNNNEKNISMDWFVESATNYQLTGKTLSELCDHNASVAMELERHQVAQSWNMIKTLYCMYTGTPSISRGVSQMTGTSENFRTDLEKVVAIHLQDKINDPQVSGDTSGGVTDEESETSDTEHERTLTNIASGLTNMHGDFFFGDGEADQIPFEFESMPVIDSAQDWTLPNEAFHPRHEIISRSPPPEQLPNPSNSPSSANESEVSSNNHVNTESDIQGVLMTTPTASNVPSWHFTPIVVEMLHYYAERGDIQMSVSVLIVLGDRVKPHVDEQTQEYWFLSYVDLLGRFQLWSVATEIIKLSNLTSVSGLNQQSTVVHTNCNRCSKALARCGWICDRCKTLTNSCSICHLTVKGLYVWCQGCSHGGHLQHIQEWIHTSPWCPAGCGHRCEYSPLQWDYPFPSRDYTSDRNRWRTAML